jgi:hypothetical protein
MKTIKELCQDALNVQNACNLSGVAISFGQAMRDLRAIEPNLSTDQLNTHPIAVLWSSKIASLTGSEGASEFSKAYNACCDYVEGKRLSPFLPS